MKGREVGVKIRNEWGRVLLPWRGHQESVLKGALEHGSLGWRERVCEVKLGGGGEIQL